MKSHHSTTRRCPLKRLLGWHSDTLRLEHLYLHMAVLLAFLAAPAALLSQPSEAFLAEHCAENVVSANQQALNQADLTQQDIFNRMYIPIHWTFPKQYHTSYDSWADNALTSILTRTLTERKPLNCYCLWEIDS